jgi:steroid delta-isomerase-like uncharacterized protein
MFGQNNKKVIEAYFSEVLAGQPKTPSLVDKYIAEEDLKQHIAFFEAAFPGYVLDLEDMVAEGDKVAVRTTFRGKHLGEFNGIPATGKEVSIPIMLIYRLEHGKIVEHWMNADSLGLLQQVGAIPVPA